MDFHVTLVIIGFFFLTAEADINIQQNPTSETSRNILLDRSNFNLHPAEVHRLRRKRQYSDWNCRFEYDLNAPEQWMVMKGSQCDGIQNAVEAVLLQQPTCDDLQQETKIKNESFNQSIDNSIEIKFTNMKPGNYCLVLIPKPVQTYKMITWNFSFPEYVPTPVIIVVSPPPEDADYGSLILYTMIGVLISLCLIASVVVYKRISKHRRRSENINNEDEVIAEVIHIKKKTVFIIFSVDCEWHRKVVGLFADILEKYFECKVWCCSNDEDVNDIEENRAMYIINKLNKSDIILLINSEGAYYKYIALQNKQSLYRSSVEDIFCEAVMSLSHDNRKKFDYACTINVRFDYTSTQYIPNHYIAPNKHYVLPEQMKELFSQIHGLDVRNGEDELTKCGYYESDSHKQLVDAVEKASDFLRRNPCAIKENIISLQVENDANY